MPRVYVIGRDGRQTTIEASADSPLMYGLRDAGLPVEGTCGGYAACGSCHVYVPIEWQKHLPGKEELEIDMLALLDAMDQERSRLSCQIVMTDELDGLVIELAPEA